ncbi:SRPBCC family protein [Rhodococcus sp. NPDC047139]|uniref:SRPBCC family protein n=1 Tax=Rhodococcus sp. NPDC047139 TaxID=3155141 RepID=UPI0033F74F9B
MSTQLVRSRHIARVVRCAPERVYRFAANDYGVLDHEVTMPSGTSVYNPMRVLPHPDGAEFVFTVRRIEQTDEEFDRDTGMVEEDLARLAALLES